MPSAASRLIASCSAAEQLPTLPRLTLITRAGLGLAGTPDTEIPPAHSMPSTVSDSSAPHLPDVRTGTMRVFQPTPAISSALLVPAASTLITSVPCQVLLPMSLLVQPLIAETSALVTPSPVSCASLPRPVLLPARAGSEMKL